MAFDAKNGDASTLPSVQRVRSSMSLCKLIGERGTHPARATEAPAPAFFEAGCQFTPPPEAMAATSKPPPSAGCPCSQIRTRPALEMRP